LNIFLNISASALVAESQSTSATPVPTSQI